MPDALICYAGSIEKLKLLGATYLLTYLQQSLKSWNVEFCSNNRRSSSPSRRCSSANRNTQLHNMISHGAVNHPTIRYFTAPPTGM
jgi:hypothetical protein